MAEISEIKELARMLNLMNIANGIIDLDDEKLSNKDYIFKIFQQEVQLRRANRLKDYRKIAKLPNKTFDETRITEGLKWQLSKLEDFNFTESKQNIFIVGDCSTGKTSLAAKLGNDAIDKGAKVKYITLDDLLLEHKTKKRRWNNILESDVIIIDDVFYVTPSNEE